MKAWDAVKPYLERESMAAFFVGVSSGFPYAMIGATLTTRLAQDGIDKKTVTAFALAFLVYNLKVFWAWIVDGVRIPLLGRLGQRVSWLLVAGVAVWNAGEYTTYFRVLETEDEYFDYYRKRHAFWKMYGLGLPDEVLKKVYYKNALRIIPAIDRSAFPD